MDDAIARIEELGGQVVRNVPLITLADIAKQPGSDDPDNFYGR